ALLLLLVGACGKASSSSGSNSNWLQPCDVATDCGAGFECWCHVCTTPCGAAKACNQPGASCENAAARGCGEVSASASICVAQCETAADCLAFGAEFSCLNEACVVIADTGPSSGGTSSVDAGGSGGTTAAPVGEVDAIAVGENHRCVASSGRV